jgi:hypothetical protein
MHEDYRRHVRSELILCQMCDVERANPQFSGRTEHFGHLEINRNAKGNVERECDG